MRKVYSFHLYCDKCKKYYQRHEVKDFKRHPKCPECDADLKWKAVDKRNQPFKLRKYGESHVDALYAENERWSEAMGINPDQRPEFAKKFPWMEFDYEGRCRVRNRAEKLRIMKARGFVERG